ncbi:hypothetical protein BSKO_07579 [Bryopsis sp. KO-2023]|nr:hypothetical protein BSKO_07579 [Bryopsis sp. KO-2023]
MAEEITAGECSLAAGPSDVDVCNKDAEKKTLGRVETGHTRFWNPFDLRFEDEDLEAWFSRDRMADWLEADSFAHAMSFVPPLITLMVTGKSLSPVLKLSLLGSSATCPLLYLWTSKPSYARYRSATLSASRIATAVQAASVAVSGLSRSVSGGSFLGRLMIWGPLAPMVVSSVNVRLPFRVHFPAQIAATLLCTFWLQAMCFNGSQFGWMFNSIGEGLDGLMVKMYLPFITDAERGITVPCYAVVSFLHMMVGFVMPTLLVFVLEVQSRAEFLMKVLGSEHHDGIHRFLHDALWFGCWAALFFAQASWAVLSLSTGPN